MGEVVDVVGNIISDSRINDWSLGLPSDDLHVPDLENLKELVPVC